MTDALTPHCMRNTESSTAMTSQSALNSSLASTFALLKSPSLSGAGCFFFPPSLWHILRMAGRQSGRKREGGLVFSKAIMVWTAFKWHLDAGWLNCNHAAHDNTVPQTHYTEMAVIGQWRQIGVNSIKSSDFWHSGINLVSHALKVLEREWVAVQLVWLVLTWQRGGERSQLTTLFFTN